MRPKARAGATFLEYTYLLGAKGLFYERFVAGKDDPYRRVYFCTGAETTMRNDRRRHCRMVRGGREKRKRRAFEKAELPRRPRGFRLKKLYGMALVGRSRRLSLTRAAHPRIDGTFKAFFFWTPHRHGGRPAGAAHATLRRRRAKSQR